MDYPKSFKLPIARFANLHLASSGIGFSSSFCAVGFHCLFRKLDVVPVAFGVSPRRIIRYPRDIPAVPRLSALPFAPSPGTTISTFPAALIRPSINSVRVISCRCAWTTVRSPWAPTQLANLP